VPRPLREGTAAALLRHIIEEAKRRRSRRLRLESGSAAAFGRGRTLYAKHGFVACGPVADYVEDPYCVFMSRDV
jgi:putative acetyltransferase